MGDTSTTTQRPRHLREELYDVLRHRGKNWLLMLHTGTPPEQSEAMQWFATSLAAAIEDAIDNATAPLYAETHTHEPSSERPVPLPAVARDVVQVMQQWTRMWRLLNNAYGELLQLPQERLSDAQAARISDLRRDMYAVLWPDGR